MEQSVELQRAWALKWKDSAWPWQDTTGIESKSVEKAAFYNVEAFVSYGIAEILAFVQRMQIGLCWIDLVSGGHPKVVHNLTT
jgi:hypothetical protein